PRRRDGNDLVEPEARAPSRRSAARRPDLDAEGESADQAPCLARRERDARPRPWLLVREPGEPSGSVVADGRRTARGNQDWSPGDRGRTLGGRRRRSLDAGDDRRRPDPDAGEVAEGRTGT